MSVLKRIRLHNFKSFSHSELFFGPLTVLLGTNASGKSNLKDALRFLNGISRGYSLSEILNEKRATDGTLVWTGIRGGTSQLIFKGLKEFEIDTTFDFSKDGKKQELSYIIQGVSFRPNLLRVTRESLYQDGAIVFDSHPQDNPPVQEDVNLLSIAFANKDGVPDFLSFDNTYPMLPQVAESRRVADDLAAIAKSALDVLSAIHFLDLDPHCLRQPSFDFQKILGEHGENLPSAISHLSSTEDMSSALADWLSELASIEVTDFHFEFDLSGRLQLQLTQSDGWKASASSASDGTLRFLGLLVALLGAKSPSLFVLEEVENGIHPSRVQLLMQLMNHVASTRNVQILATSHSPQVLQELSEVSLEDAWLVYRPKQRKDSQVKSVKEIVNLAKLTDSPDFAKLHTMGWFETVLNLLEDS